MLISHMSISQVLINLCAIRQNRKKNTFEDIVCSVLVLKKSWYKRFKAKQSVKLRNGFIKLNNYSKQLAVLFKIHVDFECFKRGLKW